MAAATDGMYEVQGYSERRGPAEQERIFAYIFKKSGKNENEQLAYLEVN